MKNKFFLIFTIILLTYSVAYGQITKKPHIYKENSTTKNIGEDESKSIENEENQLSAMSKLSVDNMAEDENLILVNEEYTLLEDYKPEDLTIPKVKFPFEEKLEKKYLRKNAAKALEELFNAAKVEGDFNLFAVSAFKSFKSLENLGQNKLHQNVKKAGQNEYQTGLAVDISTEELLFQLTNDFAETPEGKWVNDNAHRFGFIVRYPKGKELITKNNYEPYHLRYVGVDHATAMFNNSMTLEEFLNKAPRIEVPEDEISENQKDKKNKKDKK